MKFAKGHGSPRIQPVHRTPSYDQKKSYSVASPAKITSQGKTAATSKYGSQLEDQKLTKSELSAEYAAHRVQIVPKSKPAEQNTSNLNVMSPVASEGSNVQVRTIP